MNGRGTKFEFEVHLFGPEWNDRVELPEGERLAIVWLGKRRLWMGNVSWRSDCDFIMARHQACDEALDHVAQRFMGGSTP